MSRIAGGTTRTLITPCGKVFRGEIREANGKYRLHKRICELCKQVPNPSDKPSEGSRKNDASGITYSKHGNPILQKDTMITARSNDEAKNIMCNGMKKQEAIELLQKINNLEIQK